MIPKYFETVFLVVAFYYIHRLFIYKYEVVCGSRVHKNIEIAFYFSIVNPACDEYLLYLFCTINALNRQNSEEGSGFLIFILAFFSSYMLKNEK